jgi:hypothetical protein
MIRHATRLLKYVAHFLLLFTDITQNLATNKTNFKKHNSLRFSVIKNVFNITYHST